MTGFLPNYREYVSGTEAHPTYHMFSALVALSSIVSRRVWIDMGHFKVFPNLYVVLVGPAGNRKTSAMTPAKNLMRELKIPFSAECVTKEKLVLDVKDTEQVIANMPTEHEDQKMFSPMTVMVTELSEFLGGGGLGMVNFLTTIYDQDFYDIRTKNKGDTVITGPYLTLLACTTPDWITTYLKQDVISGGFSRRAIFVYETGKAGRIAFPTVTPAMADAWIRLKAYSRQVQQLCGPLTWDPAAKKFFEDWYMKLKMPNDPTTTGYFETKHMQLLKVATLLSISESTDMILTTEHLKTGLEFLQLIENNLSRVFAGIGRNELNSVAAKIMNIIDSCPTRKFKVGGVEHDLPFIHEKRLKAMVYRDARGGELTETFQHLLEANKITRQIIDGKPLFIKLPEESED